MPLRGAPLLLGALFLCAPLACAKENSEDLVRYVLGTPTAKLAPEAVPEFMKLDAAAVPASLRTSFLAKKEELLALKKIADGEKKPPLRRLGIEDKAQCKIQPGSDQALGILRLAGYEEIKEDEERYLMEKTNCDECELQEEFSLQIFSVPGKKKTDRPKRVYMMHGMDPIMTLVGEYRQGENKKGTSFFGINPAPKCR